MNRPDFSQFPAAPGVYLMKDAKSAVLYIGKAIDLRKRVKSYFGREVKERYQIKFLMERVASIETIQTRTEKEALLLEYKLIQEHRPKYNIDLKDNKTFLRVRLSAHAFPLIEVTRRVKKDGAVYFGPYTSAGACREMIDEAVKFFRLRTCSDREFANRARPCIQFDIGRCTAPCVGLVTKEEYAAQVKRAELLLNGRSRELAQELKGQMDKASLAQDYEEAARLRDVIRGVKLSVERQKVMKAGEHPLTPALSQRERGLVFNSPPPVGEGQGEGVFPFVIGIPLKKKFHLKDVPHFIECVDISNISGRAACGATVCFVDGAPMKARYRLYNIRREERPNDYAMMYEVLYRRFSRTEWGLPDLLLVDGGRGQLSTAMAVLKELNVSVPVVAVGKVGGSHRKGTDVAQIFLPGRVNPLKFKKGDPALLYLIRIRDEAHRFAIKQHRKRAKGVIVSPKDRHSGERRNPVFPAGSRPRLSPG